jgi:periplasmic divalent cation tolerance protein
MNSEVVLGYCTFPDEDVAGRLCELLVREGAIACANILPAHKALYMWNGQLQRDSEVGVWLKTSSKKKAQLKERIRAIHPYAIPSLIFVEISDGLPEFLRWIYNQSL